jgi:orotidine-5'-phosphate decarboxylase
MQHIPNHERLIVALDVPSVEQAQQMVTLLGQSVAFYKLGLELFMQPDFFPLLHWLTEKQHKKVFVDLKFHDIPRTVGAAVRNLSTHGATLTTIHAAQRAMIEEAAAHKGDMKLLAVTVLTSMTVADFADVNYTGSIDALATTRARNATTSGADGVVCSGLEAASIRHAIGNGKIILTPGIRASGKAEGDQQRVADIATALRNGADYLVVGRPILTAPNPTHAAENFQHMIENAR